METCKSFSNLTTRAWFLFLFLIISHQSISARSIGNGNPSSASASGHHVHHAPFAITFYMLDVLGQKHPSTKPATTKVNGQLPFSKPLGFFPPFGGIPLTIPDSIPMTGLPSQTLDLEGMTMSFPAITTLQELELGTVATISEDIYKGPLYGSSFLGKAQGLYVASSEDGSSHMMALTVNFNSNNDGLRFFGVHWTDVTESHVAVIGGTGKYHNANGYATIKTINGSSSSVARDRDEEYKLLVFNVYLG